jgi:hypothetical protein
MPAGHIRHFLEGDPEQPRGDVEAGGDDVFELEIWFQFGLVEGEFFGAQLS